MNGTLQILFDDDPIWMEYVDGDQRFLQSTVEKPYIFADLLNYLIIGTNMKISALKKNYTLRSKYYDALAESKKLDIALIPMTLRPRNFSVWSYTSTFMMSFHLILSGHPPAYKRDLFVVFKLFFHEVFILEIIFVALLSWVSYKCEYSPRVRLKGLAMKVENKMWDKFSQHLDTFVGLIFLKTTSTNFKSDRSRALYSLWSFLLLIKICLYTTSLLVQTTIHGKPERIESLEDILLYPNIVPWIDNVFFTGYSMSSSPVKRDVARQCEALAGQTTVNLRANHIMENVRSGKGVLLYEYFYLLLMLKTLKPIKSGFYLGKDQFNPFFVGFLVSKQMGKRFLENINMNVLHVVESGLIDSAKPLLLLHVSHLLVEDELKIQPISTFKILPSLVFLIIGLLLSTLVLLIESRSLIRDNLVNVRLELTSSTTEPTTRFQPPLFVKIGKEYSNA